MKRFRITVPATIDGLGPGTGILALALTLTDTVEVEIGDEPGNVDGEEIICRAYESWPADRRPAARFTLEKGIPEGYGLGEETARIVAGLAAAVAASEARDTRRQIFSLALEQGAVPTQLTACVMGGLTTSFRTEEELEAVHVTDHLSMDVALYLPDEPLRVGATAVDPARLSYMITALMWGRWDWLEPVMRNEPITEPVDAALRVAREAGAYGSGLTGGGLFALASLGRGEAVAAAMEECARAASLPGRRLISEVRGAGVGVQRLDDQ